LDASPRCFESASTTDVSLTSTRRENTLFGDCPPSAVGKPAGVPLRDPPRSQRRRRVRGKTPDHLAVIRPPTAPCLTARRRLRVERLPLRRFRAGRGVAQQHCPLLHASPAEPSDASSTIEKRSARALPFPFVISFRRDARQCFPRSRDRGAFRRGSPWRAPSRAPAWSSAPVGRRAQVLHVFIDVRKLRLDPSPRRSRGHFRAACASTTSADRCFNEHCLGPPEHPDQRNPWSGRLPVRSIVTFRSRQPPKVRRVRGRGSPRLGVPSRDCSRERLRPNPDRFRHLVSRALCAALSGVDEGDGRSRRRRAR
jgi:hypothetical protein